MANGHKTHKLGRQMRITAEDGSHHFTDYEENAI